MQWQSTDDELPKLKKLYFITDGKDLALARFEAEGMRWRFEWHYSVFKPTYMCEVILPPLPEPPKED